MELSQDLIESVKQHEGYREKAYQDSEGIWTIGYGTNLEVLEIDHETAEKWLLRELEWCAEQVNKIEGIGHINDARRDVLTEMAYNLGINGLRKFRKTLNFIRAAAYEQAAAEMLDSRWARQVGIRADRLSERMRRG